MYFPFPHHQLDVFQAHAGHQISGASSGTEIDLVKAPAGKRVRDMRLWGRGWEDG